MGVFQLATFMKQKLHNGKCNVSIKLECQQFQERTGTRPTLVFDVLSLAGIFRSNKIWILCGGRHQIFRNDLEIFLQRLSEFADLIFFEDGPAVNEKEDTTTQRRKYRHEQEVEIVKHIDEGKPLKEFKNVPRIQPSLGFLRTYGKYFITVTKECDTEIARYACNDPTVLAVLSDDTDFLIFPGRWRYFSIENIDLKNADMTTIEFSRSALHNHLELNDKQMIVLSTISGNDVLGRQEVHNFHRRNDCLGANKFPLLATYIKGLPMKYYALIHTIASEVLNDDRPETMEMIKESLEQYNIKFDTVDYSSNPLLQFCLEHKLKSCLKALVRFDMKRKICEIEEKPFEYFDNYNHALTHFLKKIFGVLFQHKRSTEVYEKNYEPIYPDATVPPLLELLNRDAHPEHDSLRFQLLKWIISDELLAPHDLALIPQKYLLYVITLVYMRANGFITVPEADVILYTIRQVAQQLVPIALEAPEIIDKRAFRISLQFNKLMSHMGQAIEFLGLRNPVKSAGFDGVYFNVKYLESEFSAIDHLDDFTAYRLYA